MGLAEIIAWAVMAFAAGGVFWFIAGALRNRRRADRELARLEPLLERLGADRAGAWVAPGTLRISIGKGRSAIARSTVVLLLEPREVGVLWLINRWKGRRDLLVIRCSLRRAPQRWAELFRSTGTIGAQVRSALAKSGKPLTSERSFPNELSGLGERGSDALIDRLWEIWASRCRFVLRVGARPTEPELVVAIALHDDVDWPAIASAVTETAETIAGDFARR